MKAVSDGEGRIAPIAAKILEWTSRFGYAARGVVNVTVGVIALLSAYHLTPHAVGAADAIEAWAKWPPGLALIAFAAIGLAGFALWRSLQAVLDADGHGKSLKGWGVRTGQAASGMVAAALSLSAFKVLHRIFEVRTAQDGVSAHDIAVMLLSTPHGDTYLMGAGLIMLFTGAGFAAQGLGQDFGKRLDCADETCRWVVPLARAGYVSRGVATLPLGFYLYRAGLQARAAEARSWGDALDTLAQHRLGGLAMIVVAVGLIAFGLFGFVEARFRRIKPFDSIDALPSEALAANA
ncbi:MAG: DUF1206 domain-containing protein [Caulobacteraceae bacterium]